MFLTRIQRGAIRTNILLRAKAERVRLAYANAEVFRSRQRIASTSGLRTLAVCTAAVYTAVLPVLPLPAQAAASHPGSSVEDAGEPPSLLPGLPASSISAIRVESQVTSSLVIATDRLSGVSVGDSRDTVRLQKEEQERQAELQRLKAEQERQIEAARVAALRQAAVLASTSSATPSEAEQALHAATAAAFGEDQWPAMRALVMRESGINPNSYNVSSGACGMFQAFPCYKMGGMELITQVNWGIGYIRGRYGSPTGAWAHELAVGWY